MMADDSELEKRAIEELLRETTRARVRAETMGPAGWMKCPLQTTNKRFLLNTLRSTTGPMAGQSTTRGSSTSESRSKDSGHSKSHRDNGGHKDHKTHRSNSNNKDMRHDGEGGYCKNGRAERSQRHKKDSLNKDGKTHRLPSRAHTPGEATRSIAVDSRGPLHSDRSSHNCSPYTGHAPDNGCQHNKTHSRSRSPVRVPNYGSIQK